MYFLLEKRDKDKKQMRLRRIGEMNGKSKDVSAGVQRNGS